MYDEPMIPKSMHDSAIEAARVFARLEAEREAMAMIARLVEAAGGEIRLVRRTLVDDPPEIEVTEEFLDNVWVYRTRRRSPSAASSQEKTESGSTAPRRRRKAGGPSR